MSTSAVSTASLSHDLHQYYQTRQSDLQQLGQALGSGNLGGAQTAFNNITTLGQTGPVANGTPFFISQRDQDFSAIGQALQAGDLAGAQQAFSALKDTFSSVGNTPFPPPVNASPGPEIILNLSNSSGNTGPEEININISNPSSGGGEQVSLSIGNEGSTAPQEITFNLGPNSNEQIVLNLLGESPSTSNSSISSSSGGTSSSGGLSVSA